MPPLNQSLIKNMRVPSSFAISTAAAELANDKIHHSLRHPRRKPRPYYAFLGLVKWGGKSTSKSKQVVAFGFWFFFGVLNYPPHLSKPKREWFLWGLLRGCLSMLFMRVPQQPQKSGVMREPSSFSDEGLWTGAPSLGYVSWASKKGNTPIGARTDAFDSCFWFRI